MYTVVKQNDHRAHFLVRMLLFFCARPVGFPMMDDKKGSLFMPDWLVLVG